MTDTEHDRARDIPRLKRWQHREVDDIRNADARCPQCKHRRLYSYIFAGDEGKTRQTRNGTTEQPCGFWCGAFGWGNGGARPVEEE